VISPAHISQFPDNPKDGVRGLKIAVVKEGFGHAKSEPDVDQTVREAAALLGKLGATITELSIPWHLLGMSIFIPIATEGATPTMMWGDGYGVSRPDLYVTSLMDRHRSWRHRADSLSETVKLFGIRKAEGPGAQNGGMLLHARCQSAGGEGLPSARLL
jgi:amidase